jgi:hypothetical protein
LAETEKWFATAAWFTLSVPLRPSDASKAVMVPLPVPALVLAVETVGLLQLPSVVQVVTLLESWLLFGRCNGHGRF